MFTTHLYHATPVASMSTHSKIGDKLPHTMKERFGSQGLEVEIAAKTPDEQAKYMFNMLESLAEADDNKTK